MKILVLGSGGREHAIVTSILKDNAVSEVFCAPGNAGTFLIAKNVDINIMDNKSIMKFVENEEIDLTIVGPEQPLANGIVDYFMKYNKYPPGFKKQVLDQKWKLDKKWFD